MEKKKFTQEFKQDTIDYYHSSGKSIREVPEEIGIKYMKYKFGSNELFIGRGLIRVMNYLEEYYNIDFAELERRKK